MAFTDVTDGSRIILEGVGVAKVTLAGDVDCGDLIGDSTGWKQADGNNSIYAEMIAGETGLDGDEITVYRAAKIGGITSGTAKATVYLSDTAGGYAVSAGTVSQRVGFELENGEMWIEPKDVVLVRAEQVDWDDTEDIASASILVGNASARPTVVAVSGEVTIDNAGVVTLAFPAVRAIVSQSLAYGAFTDGSGTSGYIDFTTTQLPAGAIPVGFKAVVSTGFANDTTAIIQVGTSGDTDRFSLVTDQSVLAAATVGSLAATDGADGMNAAQTIRVTVTGTADFTSINAGVMVVTVYYVDTV